MTSVLGSVYRRLTVLPGILALLLTCGTALADATPVQLVLLYMPNISTTGTPAASGVAELVLPEGEVRLSVTDLPRLDAPQQYVAWVVNSQTNEFLRLGAFNTAQSTGAVRYEQVLPDPIPDKHWSLLLVTVEDTPTPDRPSNVHSIAGVFPPTGSQPSPNLLPNTGGPVPVQAAASQQPEWLPSLGLAALTLLLGLGAGYRLGRHHRLTTDH